jgi:hypothetical protein
MGPDETEIPAGVQAGRLVLGQLRLCAARAVPDRNATLAKVSSQQARTIPM